MRYELQKLSQLWNEPAGKSRPKPGYRHIVSLEIVLQWAFYESISKPDQHFSDKGKDWAPE
jgi:hypothetical protein